MRELTRRYLPYPGHQQRSRRIVGGTTLAGRGTWPKSRLWSPNSPLRSPTRCWLVAWGRFPPPTCLLALGLSRRPLLRSSASCSIGPLYEGFGPLELASLDLDESPAMARQLATELNLPFRDWLVDALYCWLQEACEEAKAKIYKRAHGYHSVDLAWMSLMPPVELPDAKGSGPAFATEPPPPLGERNRKLIEDGCIVQAREERLLDIWCRKLRDELLLINAPVLASLQGSLDPDRAALLLTGSTRASTLKRYLGYYRQWRLWLGEAKLRQPPGRPSDLVDYLLSRRDEPCGRSTPEAILKAIAWVERVAEFEETLRATHGRLAWAAKDKITEILSEGARYPVFMLTLLEALVFDVGHATGWRIWAWAKLVKVWASLRWSDLQAIIPAELSLVQETPHHRAKANQNFGPQPPDKGAAGRYIRARLLPQEHLAKGGFRSAANPR